MQPPWEALRPAVDDVVGHCGEHDVVVEVGAGSGVGTSIIASACRGEVFALEPHPVMRVMLLSRVGADPDLAARVTVLDGGAPEGLVELPPRVRAGVIAHVLGHLEEDQRVQTWSRLAQCLVPGAKVLVTIQPEDDGAGEDADVVETRRLGRRTYTARHHPEPRDQKTSTFCSTYQVHHDGRLVREQSVRGHWAAVGLETVRREAALSGLHTVQVRPGLAVVTA